MIESGREIPIACSLDDPARAWRLAEIEATLVAEASSIEPLPDGYALTFAATDERITTLAEFVSAERLCCPFFRFAIELPPGGETVTLSLRGADGVKSFVEQQFFASGG
jgi:hypothetical protein